MTRFGVIGLSPRQEQPGMDAIDRQDSLPRASFDRYRPEGDLQVGPMNGQKAREADFGRRRGSRGGPSFRMQALGPKRDSRVA